MSATLPAVPPLFPALWADECGGISLPIVRPRPTPTVGLVFAAAALMMAGWRAVATSDLTVNLTPSLPVGIYQRIPLPAHLKPGELVQLCPLSPAASPAMLQALHDHWLLTDRRSPCVDHLVPFDKKIAAIPGQSVNLSVSGITVNNHLLPRTKIQPVSRTGGRIIHFPLGRYRVRPGTIWVTDNSSPWAYDSRYYGPVSVGNLISGLRPVATW